MRKWILILLSLLVLVGCSVDEVIDEVLDIFGDVEENEIESIDELQDTDAFRKGALEHILEGELNGKGQAVGFHYDGLPTKKGEIIEGTKSSKNDQGVYEAKVKVSDVEKTSNNGKSTFFPDDWSAQEVVDAINEAYENSAFISGNTYEGLTEDGVTVRMYLDNNEKIISAFPVY